MSRSSSTIQPGHVQLRTDNGRESTLCPQQEQVLELANHWSILTRCLPCSFALYSNFWIKADQLASAMCLDSFRLLSMFLTFSVSTITAWFSSMSCRDRLCWKSARAFVRRSFALASFNRAFVRPLLPFWQRDRAFCLRRRFAVARFKNRGLAILLPSESIARWVSPISTPSTVSTVCNGAGVSKPSSTKSEA